mmetsp:Transcript_39864/g.93892  ORF Transcript_39864/g.93892 Transcript_39864/m.93892 type:complete len:870 (+) Transcript_39864:65-2674(+)
MADVCYDSCIVYNRGEAPEIDAILDQGWGWFVVIGFGLFFTAFSMSLTQIEEKVLGHSMSSEQFNTAGRNVGAGLTAAVIVSQWTWAATLLMSSNMGWRVGVSGPFWYASGATVQILLFAVLAIQVKRRASHMHTFMEIVKARFGTITHCIMIVFALMANMIVTSMLLLGGAATISDLTGMSKIWASFLIPLLSCWIYTMHGGLKATFFASYVHTTVIFFMLLIFSFSVYAGSGDSSNLYGSPSNVYDGLEKASLYGLFNATYEPQQTVTMGVADPSTPPASTGMFSALGAFIENDGTCYKTATMAKTDKECKYERRDKDAWCCDKSASSALGDQYCRRDNSNCIDISAAEHYEDTECGSDEKCVPSFLTMGSEAGIKFGITNIVGNFGTVFVDQSYWQSAVAAKPKSAVLGFLIGGMVWFAVPFCMATTNGLVGRALTTHPDLGTLYIDADASGAGLTPARALSHILGSGGAFILLLQLFMAITSTGSAEIIAVSSILTYDIYYEYINPELKNRREGLRAIFYEAVGGVANNGRVAIDSIQGLMSTLVSKKFFDKEVPDKEVTALAVAINSFTSDGTIATDDLYSALNRAVSSNSIEGVILLRVSKFFTAVFAIFMGFLAVFLQTLGFSLGWVYMSMGVLIGSAVGPASLTILMETANGIFIAAGAVGGLALGMAGWCIRAQVEFDGVDYDTLGSDWPWVVGNLCAIIGGLVISLGGSLLFPDKSFKWSMLNERIPLVDDIEPPKDDQETDNKLELQVKIAMVASVLLTVVLLVLWPIPMHYGAGVFSEGGFTIWVALEMIWAIVGGVVIIGLPVYETIVGVIQEKKQKEALDASMQAHDAKLSNGTMLKIEGVKNDVQAAAPSSYEA